MSLQKHLQTGEEVLYRAHPSRIPLAPPLALAAVAAVAGLFAWRRAAAPEPSAGWRLLAIGCLVVVAAAVVAALVRFVSLSASRYVLTDRRLLRLTGILSQRSMDSYLDKINNVEHHQTLWGRLFGYGDLEIDTAAQTGVEVFARIADPLGFKRAIDAATSTYHNVAAGRVPAAAAAPAAATPPAPATPQAPPNNSERLRQLKRLLDDGLISQVEFDAKRKQLLDQL
jgi:uncharacterized membrane protein YdbT with pleckstrin-like domain